MTIAVPISAPPGHVATPRTRQRACPLCGGYSQPQFQRDGYDILDCGACGHRFAGVNPAPDHAEMVYGDDYFTGGEAGYSDYLSEAALLRARGRRYARLVGEFMPPGRLLDVGAAAGFVLQGMRDEGWSGRGLEPNRTMSRYAREQLHLDVQPGTLESFRTHDRYDLVMMIQVVAHFADVRHCFDTAAEITRDGGYWLIETWDCQSLTARMFGPRWHEYSPPSVLHWFTRAGLAELAERYGFRSVATGRPSKWINGRHARSLLEYKLGDSLLGRAAALPLKAIPDRLPIPYPAEDLFWGLYQKMG